MTDLLPAPVPELDATWFDQRREALVSELRRPRRPGRSVVGLAGATAAASAVATVLVTVGGGTTNAFAGWSADPTPPSADQVQSAQAVCQNALAAVPSTPSSGSETSSSNVVVQSDQPTNKSLPPGPYQPLLSDVRGPFTATIFGTSGTQVVLCLSTPGAVSLRFEQGPNQAPAAGTIGLDHLAFMTRDGQPYTLAEGPVGPAVTGVNLVLADGSSVTATSGGGYFIAWWPGSQGVASALVASSGGTTSQTVDLPGAPPGSVAVQTKTQ